MPNPDHLRKSIPSRYVAQVHNEEPLTSNEAAEIIGVSVATVNRMAADGRLALVHKFPGLRGPNLFERADVEWLRGELMKDGGGGESQPEPLGQSVKRTPAGDAQQAKTPPPSHASTGRAAS